MIEELIIYEESNSFRIVEKLLLWKSPPVEIEELLKKAGLSLKLLKEVLYKLAQKGLIEWIKEGKIVIHSEKMSVIKKK